MYSLQSISLRCFLATPVCTARCNGPFFQLKYLLRRQPCSRCLTTGGLLLNYLMERITVRTSLVLLTLVLSCIAIATTATAVEPFELKDGERVVFLGNTLIERDQLYGYLETALVSQWPDRNITFRNLGWSGDTVWGDARAGFDTAKQGFQRLKDLVLANKPTTIFVSYGTNESFAGEAGLPEFQKGLDTLLDAIGESKARIVIISPIAQKELGRPLPDPKEQNARLKMYCTVLEETAKKRDLLYLDMFSKFSSLYRGELTDNGIHLTQFGYWAIATEVCSKLHLAHGRRSAQIAADGKVIECNGFKIDNVTGSPATGNLKFTLQEDGGLMPLVPGLWQKRFYPSMKGLAPGMYALRIDGKKFGAWSTGDWREEEGLTFDPKNLPGEKLRQAIIAKNQLYFYRWRPQNETYLFGFRKHEQGKNAAEIVQFDPLIAEKEAEIAKLRVPQPHVYEIVREAEEKKAEEKK